MANPVVHFEIGCEDQEATKKFYQDVFDWEIKQNGPSASINTGGAISGHITALGHEPHKYINIYIEVADINTCLDSIEAQGGKRMIGPLALPDGRFFAWFTDVAGNTVGLLSANNQ